MFPFRSHHAGMQRERRLVEYPYVIVRFACVLCARRGQARLARLAERHGADITLEELLDRVAWTCPYPRPRPGQKLPKYQPFCGIMLPDIERPRPRPPDVPCPPLRLVVGDDAA